MNKTLTALTAGALMSIAGLASAAEPMQLTDSQMDTVAAGNQNENGGGSSWAVTGGYAVHGTVISGALSGTAERNGNQYTFAGAATYASGYRVSAFAAAGSSF